MMSALAVACDQSYALDPNVSTGSTSSGEPPPMTGDIIVDTTGAPLPFPDSCASPGWPCKMGDDDAYCGDNVHCIQSDAHPIGFGYCTAWCDEDTDCLQPAGICLDLGCRDALYNFTPAASCGG